MNLNEIITKADEVKASRETTKLEAERQFIRMLNLDELISSAKKDILNQNSDFHRTRPFQSNTFYGPLPMTFEQIQVTSQFIARFGYHRFTEVFDKELAELALQDVGVRRLNFWVTPPMPDAADEPTILRNGVPVQITLSKADTAKFKKLQQIALKAESAEAAEAAMAKSIKYQRELEQDAANLGLQELVEEGLIEAYFENRVKQGWIHPSKGYFVLYLGTMQHQLLEHCRKTGLAAYGSEVFDLALANIRIDGLRHFRRQKGVLGFLKNMFYFMSHQWSRLWFSSNYPRQVRIEFDYK